MCSLILLSIFAITTNLIRFTKWDLNQDFSTPLTPQISIQPKKLDGLGHHKPLKGPEILLQRSGDYPANLM
jgi:hypothetical protein